MKIYTRTGDQGETSLFGAGRVGKGHVRVEAFGTVDELNAAIGWAATRVSDRTTRERLEALQHDLFAIGAELATEPKNTTDSSSVSIEDSEISKLEAWIDEATSAVPALSNFILPGGAEAGTRLHVARACCRRAERAVVHLAHHETVWPAIPRYLNRLSDLLFAWARQVNHAAGQPEIVWKPPAPNHE